MQTTSARNSNSEGFSRKSYSLRKTSYLDLIGELRPLLGYPQHHEELVIYFHSEEHLQLTLTVDHLEWSWTDEARDRGGSEPIILRCSADLTNLKNKLTFFAKWGGNECEIVRVPVFTFSRENDFRLEVRGAGLNGETATLLINDRGADSHSRDGLIETLQVNMQKYAYEGGTVLPTHTRKAVVRQIGYQSFIDSAIFEFGDRNGILAYLNGARSYRQILQSKSNDYGYQAEIFSRVTGVPLLSIDRHCDLPVSQAVTTSVIIPCYSVDRTIPTTLASIAAQDLPEAYFQNLEVILVDDGSRVAVETLLRGRKFNFKIRVLRLSENHGVSHARSIGVGESRGEILVFCDGDVVLSRQYLRDHLARNLVITNAFFLSFKENVHPDDPRLSPTAIADGVTLPDYTADPRVTQPDALQNTNRSPARPLEETNYFKSFHGSREVGTKRLTNMVYGHNCSARREIVLAAAPFDRRFVGWGKEDIYFALKMISKGNFIIPVLSSGVLHIHHPPRSGSEQAKSENIESTASLSSEFSTSSAEQISNLAGSRTRSS